MFVFDRFVRPGAAAARRWPTARRHTDCARAHAVRPLSTRVTKETRTQWPWSLYARTGECPCVSAFVSASRVSPPHSSQHHASDCLRSRHSPALRLQDRCRCLVRRRLRSLVKSRPVSSSLVKSRPVSSGPLCQTTAVAAAATVASAATAAAIVVATAAATVATAAATVVTTVAEPAPWGDRHLVPYGDRHLVPCAEIAISSPEEIAHDAREGEPLSVGLSASAVALPSAVELEGGV